jgi:SAM-dependent methyltransferase
MKKIYTIRNIKEQQSHLWNQRAVEKEVAACANRNIAEQFMRHLPRDEMILEAGCGLGAWVMHLDEKGYKIAGVDNDINVLERLKAWKPSLDVFYGDIRTLPYDDSSLGAYISLGVVEHFEEGCDEAMLEAWRLLKPGGLLFFAVPMENLFRKAIAHPLRTLYLKWRKFKGDSIHFAEYRYTPTEARKNLLEKYGFEILESTWDDFLPKDMSLGIWTDFPHLHAGETYTMNLFGRAAAFFFNSISRWLVSGGVFILARKPVE